MPPVEAAHEQESIGKRLRRLRLERGLSQRELSGPGVSYAYVSRIEAGQRDPSLKAIRRLARNLGVPYEYLETGEPIPPAYDRQMRLSDAELSLRLEGATEALVEGLWALLKEAREEADADAEVRARITVGLALAEMGEYRQAITQLEKATASAAVTPAAKPDVYNALGRCYAAAGQGRRSVELFEDALTTLPVEDLGLHVRFTSYLSCALADRGELQRAREVLMNLAERAEGDMDAQGRVNLYWSMSRVEKMNGEHVAAMNLARRALGLLDAYEDTLEVARGHLLCAEILLSNEDAAQATSHLERAERLFELGADRDDRGALRTQQALHAVILEQGDEAEALAQEALDFLGETTIDQGSAWYALGRAQLLKGTTGGAIESFQRAAELIGESGEWREALAVYRAWARALRKEGREAEAFDVMEEATRVSIRHLTAKARAGYPAERPVQAQP